MTVVQERRVEVTYQPGLHHLAVHIGVLGRFHDLERDLDHASGEVSDGDEMPQGRLQNGLQLSLSSPYQETNNSSTRQSCNRLQSS